jgi:hypothetical protein
VLAELKRHRLAETEDDLDKTFSAYKSSYTTFVVMMVECWRYRSSIILKKRFECSGFRFKVEESPTTKPANSILAVCVSPTGEQI